MAGTPGSGTAGAGQNGPFPTGPAYGPGEVITTALGAANSSAAGGNIDSAVGANIVTKAYDLAAFASLRPHLIFDQLAQVRSTNQSHRGSSCQFTFVGDIAEQTTPLLENLDVDSVSMTSTTVNVPLLEYGTAVTTTALLRGTGFIPFDPIAAERVGYNAGLSIDSLARVALDAATTTVGTNTKPFSSWNLREAVMVLQTKNVMPFAGGLYVAVISPIQAQQLKSEADAAGWRWVVGNEPGAGNSIYTGEIGQYEGCRIIVNNHLGAAGKGYVMGAEALAKGFSSAPGFGPNPGVVVSPVVDKLRRFASVGWYHLVGYSKFRDEAIVKLDTLATATPTP